MANKCKAAAAVKLYSVQGGGHTWPGGPQYLPEATIGKTSRDFDASRTIWTFFAGHGALTSRGSSAVFSGRDG